MISQNALQSFQDEMGKVLNDPYKVHSRSSFFCLILNLALDELLISRNYIEL